MSDDLLENFSACAGLEVHWTDMTGKTHKVAPDVLRAVLSALGYAAANAQQIAESRARLDAEQRQTPPLLTAWVGQEFGAGLQTFRAPESPGYHEIAVDGVTMTVAAAPPRCFGIHDLTDTRLAGLGVQIYSLREGNTAEFGDFAALGRFCASAAAHGIDAIATSPVHALFPANLEHFSPYSPSSRLFLNPLYADLSVCDGALAQDNEKNGLIDWPSAATRKFNLLHRAYAEFDPHDYDAFVKFCERGGERLHRHALFDVLDMHFRNQKILSWRDWPAAFRDPNDPEVLRFAVLHQEEIGYRLFLQFVTAVSAARAQELARQSGMKIGVIADIATGIDPAGSDCWGSPDDVLNGLRIGAPPDLFNAAGQNWGITALSPVHFRKNGFGPFVAMLRANMAYAGGIRIDHAMGLSRLWVMPEGAGPAEGVYLRYPLDDLLRLISLESHRARAIVIGENLGTVPHGFNETLAHRGILGMQVLWFQHEPDGRFIAPEKWRRDAVAMTTTHDLATVAGWWNGTDIEWRAKAGMGSQNGDQAADRQERIDLKEKLWSAFLAANCVSSDHTPDAQSAIDGAICYAGKTPCRLALISAEDICGLEEQPNIPGTIDEHPNWRRRLPSGDYFSQAHVSDRLARLIGSRRS